MFRFFKPKSKFIKIPLAVLSTLWISPNGVCPSGQETDPCFDSREICDFYEKHVDRHIRGEALGVIIQLLTILDKKGGCPSVIQGDDETPGQYKAFDRITLGEHSLNVARTAFEMLNRGRQIARTETPDMLICALAHDIGKIPDIRQNKVQGHTFSSLTFLQPLLTGMGAGEKILEAVRLLHVKDRKTNNNLLQILKQADTQARRAEKKTVQARSTAQPERCEKQPEKKEIDTKALDKQTLYQALKPLLLRDVTESFMFKDKIFVSPEFLMEKLAGKQSGPNFLKSCTKERVFDLIGWSLPIPVFTVRFYKKKRKPITQEYIVLNKKMFGDLSGIEERRNLLGVKRVICINQSAKS
ncbi:MAG: HD domain-containing protein [Anaerohalosphaeraceae bacterium]|nr:HD domain-containing protein [Anaerohalosphaeraceae bacterium]